MRRDRRDLLELTGAGAERILLGRVDPHGLGSEALRVVALWTRSLGEEVGRSAHHHGSADEGRDAEPDSEERQRAPRAAAAQREHDEHHDHAERKVEPRAAREREEHAERECDEADRLRSAGSRAGRAVTSNSSIRISAAGMRNGPKTFGSWKKRAHAAVLEQELGARERHEQRQRAEQGRRDRREDIAARDQRARRGETT